MSLTISRPIPIRFHQIREDDTPEKLAAKHNIDVASILKENAGAEFKKGEIIVIPLTFQGCLNV